MPFSIELLVIIFLSAFIQSAFGFGFILFSLSVGSLFFPVKEFLPFCLIMGIFIDFFLAVTNFKYRPKKHFDFILMGVLGSPIGVFLYFLMDSNIFDPILGILLIICVLLTFYDKILIPSAKDFAVFCWFFDGYFSGCLWYFWSICKFGIAVRSDIKSKEYDIFNERILFCGGFNFIAMFLL